MRRLMYLLALLPALALVGCGNGLYYQTRYIPTDIDVAFALSIGGEELELPAAPPDLDGEHPPRKDCLYPYQKFKPIAKVQVKPEAIRSSGGADLQKLVDTNDAIRLKGPEVAMRNPPIMVYGNSPYAPGVTQKAFYQPIADNDRRPHSTTGAGTDITPQPVKVDGGLNSKNFDPYCCGDGPGTGTTNAGFGPGR